MSICMTIYIYLKNHGFINLVTLCSTVMLIKTIYLVQHTIIEYSVSGFFFPDVTCSHLFGCIKNNLKITAGGSFAILLPSECS